MVRLFVIFFAGVAAALAMRPVLNNARRKESQETRLKYTKEQGRRITEDDSSSLLERNNFNIASAKEKTSTEKADSEQMMNLSTSNESVAPLITLEQCQRAISEYPNAGNLVIQSDDRGTVLKVAPPAFYNHLISAFPPILIESKKTADELIPDKSRQITKELFGLLRQEYGEKIAAASFPSLPHRIAIAHPLSTKDLSEILTTAEVLKEQGEGFPAMESDPQVQALAQEVQASEIKVDQITKAAQKKNASINKKPWSNPPTSSILQLASLERAAHHAHQEAIAVKDRLAIAQRNIFREEDPSFSSKESTPLLSQKNNQKNYFSINRASPSKETI